MTAVLFDFGRARAERRAVMMGACPDCGAIDGCIDDGCDQWSYCDAHCVRWYAGGNALNAWRIETDAGPAHAAAILATYRAVRGLFRSAPPLGSAVPF